MTPTEIYLYGMTRFKIEDDVLIAGELFGSVTGIKVTTSGEDEYRIFHYDNCGNPREEWFRDSLLEPDDETEAVAAANSNVIQFPATRH